MDLELVITFLNPRGFRIERAYFKLYKLLFDFELVIILLKLRGFRLEKKINDTICWSTWNWWLYF